MGIPTQKQYTAFNGGALSPRVYGQTNLNKYEFSLAGCENLLLWVQGPAVRRSGWRYVNEVKDSSMTQRLIEFRFNRSQTYILEFGENYIRFFTNQGFIETTPSSGVPFEVVTTYTEAQVAEFDFAQVNDIMYIVHPDKKPAKLSRTSDTTWPLADVVFKDGPYGDIIEDQDQVPSIAIDNPSPGSHQLTILNHTFTADDVGRLIRFRQNSANNKWVWAPITAYISPNVVTITPTSENINDPIAGNNGGPGFRLGEWTDTLGYPGKITLHQNRAVFSGMTLKPQTLFFTESGDFESHAPTNVEGDIVDSSGFDYTLTADQVNIVQWMKSLDTLFIGTTEGEFVIQGGTDEVLTPTATSSARISNFGSEGVRPPIAMESLMFVQRAGRKVREISPRSAVENFQAPDLTKLADHLTLSGIVDMAYQQEPNSILWCAKDDGELLALTFDKTENVFGWGNHPIGGVDAKIMNVAATAAGSTGQTTYNGSPRVKRDELWGIISRTIDSTTKKYVEFMEEEWDHDTVAADSLFFDSGISYSGPAITHVTGLLHLAGETVGIIADGSVVLDQVVSPTGTIDLTTAASSIHVGLKYRSLFETLDLEQPLPDGASMGRTKRIRDISIRFYRTMSAYYGESGGELDEVIFRTSTSPLDAPLPPYSGVKNFTMQGSYRDGVRVIVETDEGLPFGISSLGVRMETNAAVH